MGLILPNMYSKNQKIPFKVPLNIKEILSTLLDPPSFFNHIWHFIITKRYSHLRGPTCSSCAEGFGQGLFLPFGEKKLIILYWPILGHFWCPVVTLVIISSNLSNFKRIQKKLTWNIKKNNNNNIIHKRP